MAERKGTIASAAADERATRQEKPVLERYRLQVDGQTKSSFATAQAAEAAGAAIKKKFQIVHVTVYDGVTGEARVLS